MSPHRIPVLFPESLRSHLFFVKINSEARLRGDAETPLRSKPIGLRENPAPIEKPAGTLGVPCSPLND